MAPYLLAVCSLLCLAASSAFVVPSPRAIASHRCAHSTVRSRNILPLQAGGSSDEIFAKVKSIVVQEMGVEEANVVPSASFVDDLGADGLDLVDLIMAFEEAFEIEFEEAEYPQITTVQLAVEYIGEK